ncbi:MAG: SDR family oxidoreductase [bacterium]|jgi:3-oxoacyl-[acyl-carrier protein] reductase|nr:SDR family oxidoreductase [candidate division KSB1 bacterium]MDH7560711.1 SDR family oxidoreductase [bacterium]
MNLQLDGQVALITGATGCIGSAVTMSLARSGADVAIGFCENKQKAEDLAQEALRMGRRALTVQADVTSEHQTLALIAEVERRFGRLDILINVVGHFLQKPLVETTAAEWQEMLETNVTSAFLLCKAALSGMRRRRHGRIVNLGLAGLEAGHGFAQIGAHAVAKAALLSLTRSLAKQEAGHGVTVNMVAPGFVYGPQVSEAQARELAARIPAGRLASAAEVASAVVFLASPAASYITGTVIEVAGGWGL